MFKKILLSIVVLVVVVLAAVYFVRNYLVERAVESGCTYALGVQTDLGSARLEIGGGSLALNNLEIRNPEGFANKNVLELRQGVLDVDAGSVLDDEVVVDSLVISGVSLNLEQIDRKGNFRVLMDNLKKVDLPIPASEEPQRFRVGLVALRDINVSALLSLLGKEYKKSYGVENITLRNISSDKGATISQITAKVMQALLSKAVAAGTGVLPEGFGANLSELKDEAVKKLETKVTDEVKDLGKSLIPGKK